MRDFCEETEYDSIAEYPSKLRFMKNGEVYDICVAETGKENTLNVLCSRFITEPCKFLVIVNDLDQISKLTLDNVVAYCIVSDDGEVKYYRKEGDL